MSISNYSSIKNRFSLIIISIQLLLNFVLCQNIILNPGFENGTTTNWTEVGTASSITQSSTYKYSGSYSCKFTNPTSSYSARGVQSDFINVTAGEYYDLSGWFYVDNEGSGVISDTDFRLRVYWFLSDQTTACDPASNPSTTGWSIDSFDTWSKKELTDLQAPSNAAYAYVLVECKESSNNNNDAYIDDISLIPSVSISGTSGFRMMSSPVSGTIYSDLLAELWIQGMTGGDVTSGDANVWTFDVSSQGWSALSNLSTASQTAGHGFLVYVFADTDFDGDDDLPVTLSVSGTANSSSATVPSSGSIADGEYALAGNPYAQTIDWDDVTKTNMSSTVYVYDDAKSGGAGWIDWNGSAGDLSNGLIAPYQGFIIKGSGGSGTITIETADQASSSGTFYKTAQTYSATFTVTSETSSQNFYFSFNQDGNVGMDSHDAHKLMPLDITPRLVGMTFADGNSLGTNNLPLNLTGSTEIDVDVMSLDVTDGVFETAGEDVTLSWDLSAAPAGLSFMLTNTQTQETADLSLTDAYTFTTQEKGSVVSDGSGVSSYPLVGTPLLKLTISALSQNVDENPMPSAFALHPAYPNPFNPSTTITFDVPDYIAQPTLLQIYDISGSLVQTLVNGVVDPGTHSVSWGPKNLSSGIYIVELRAGDNTFNHKISYVK